MSTLDQPLLIANVNYHVGHWVAIYVAEEQGFFKDEGLTRYEYERAGLLPGPWEREGLGLAIKEHGVDVATAARNRPSVKGFKALMSASSAVGAIRHSLNGMAPNISPISANSAAARSASEKVRRTVEALSNSSSRRP